MVFDVIAVMEIDQHTALLAIDRPSESSMNDLEASERGEAAFDEFSCRLELRVTDEIHIGTRSQCLWIESRLLSGVASRLDAPGDSIGIGVQREHDAVCSAGG